MACIKELKAKGKTVVLVTHKTNLLAMSDKTLMLVDGTVEKFGNTKEMFQPKAQPNPADKPAAAATAAAVAPVVQMQKKPAQSPSGA